MTPDQEKTYDKLNDQASRAAKRLQSFVNALADAAIEREFGSKFGFSSEVDEADLLRKYEDTLKQIDDIADQQERLLKEVGILR